MLRVRKGFSGQEMEQITYARGYTARRSGNRWTAWYQESPGASSHGRSDPRFPAHRLPLGPCTSPNTGLSMPHRWLPTCMANCGCYRDRRKSFRWRVDGSSATTCRLSAYRRILHPGQHYCLCVITWHAWYTRTIRVNDRDDIEVEFVDKGLDSRISAVLGQKLECLVFSHLLGLVHDLISSVAQASEQTMVAIHSRAWTVPWKRIAVLEFLPPLPQICIPVRVLPSTEVPVVMISEFSPYCFVAWELSVGWLATKFIPSKQSEQISMKHRTELRNYNKSAAPALYTHQTQGPVKIGSSS